MSTYEFIKQNESRIINIDGGLDDGNITIMTDEEFDGKEIKQVSKSEAHSNTFLAGTGFKF